MARSRTILLHSCGCDRSPLWADRIHAARVEEDAKRSRRCVAYSAVVRRPQTPAVAALHGVDRGGPDGPALVFSTLRQEIVSGPRARRPRFPRDESFGFASGVRTVPRGRF